MYILKGIVYNSTMNKDNIIQFPYGEIRNPILDPNPNDKMDIAGECIQEILITLSEYGYSAKDDKIFHKDMGCLLNMIYAMLAREDHPDYPFVEILDVIHEMIMETKNDHT